MTLLAALAAFESGCAYATRTQSLVELPSYLEPGDNVTITGADGGTTTGTLVRLPDSQDAAFTVALPSGNREVPATCVVEIERQERRIVQGLTRGAAGGVGVGLTFLWLGLAEGGDDVDREFLVGIVPAWVAIGSVVGLIEGIRNTFRPIYRSDDATTDCMPVP